MALVTEIHSFNNQCEVNMNFLNSLKPNQPKPFTGELEHNYYFKEFNKSYVYQNYLAAILVGSTGVEITLSEILRELKDEFRNQVKKTNFEAISEKGGLIPMLETLYDDKNSVYLITKELYQKILKLDVIRTKYVHGVTKFNHDIKSKGSKHLGWQQTDPYTIIRLYAPQYLHLIKEDADFIAEVFYEITYLTSDFIDLYIPPKSENGVYYMTFPITSITSGVETETN